MASNTWSHSCVKKLISKLSRMVVIRLGKVGKREMGKG